jgi:hypothetical protein
MKTGTHDRGTTLFPLYRYESILGGRKSKVHNLRDDFVGRWQSLSGIPLAGTKDRPTGGSASPEDLFYWIYGMCHAPSYRVRYRAQLAQGFAVVLFPAVRSVFDDVARLGRDLVSYSLLEARQLTDVQSTYEGQPNPIVQRVGWLDGSVWLDAPRTSARSGYRALEPGTSGFSGVSEAVWNLHVGGYQVSHKWLKDRKGRRLKREDRSKYQRILAALAATLRLMPELDDTIEANGGWTTAFKFASDE